MKTSNNKMSKEHPLSTILKNRKKKIPKGIYSICSSNIYVLEAAIKKAKNEEVLLIEATPNQVNQNGGYSGMTPKEFVKFVQQHDITVKENQDLYIQYSQAIEGIWRTTLMAIAHHMEFEMHASDKFDEVMNLINLGAQKITMNACPFVKLYN